MCKRQWDVQKNNKMCKKNNKMYKKRKKKTVYWDLINSNVNKRDVQTKNKENKNNFIKKCLFFETLCSEDEQRSYGFGTIWGWEIFIFGWTNFLMF